LVVLDEPTTGLDVDARRTLWDGVRSFHETGGTVLLTSHYLEEVEALAERVVVIDGGRVVTDDTLDAVCAGVDLRRVSLRSPAVPDLPGMVRHESEAGVHHLYTPDADALVRDLVVSGHEFSGLEVRGASLEEAFLALTARVKENAR
jgi:ABC-2 type transport system ATP-binding protein